MPLIAVSTDIDPARHDPNRLHEWQASVVNGHRESPGDPEPGAICRTTGPQAVVRIPGCQSIAGKSIGLPKP